MRKIKYEDVLAYMIKTGDSIRKTAAHFNITRTMPERASKEIGRKKKYALNKTILFDLNNEDSMYWLGFIAADGCIVERSANNMNLEIGLKYSDMNHLEKFKSFMKTDYEVKERVQKLSYANDKEYKSCRITIYNTEICKKLIDLKITPRKSLTLTIDDRIKESENFKHFIRGYIDGDGCFGIYDKTYILSILGTKDILESFSNYFNKFLKESNINYNMNDIKEKRDGGVNELRVSSKIVVKTILDHLYKESNTSLLRKYDIYTNM